MATALTWLNDLFQWLGRWIPRFVLVHPTHCGVLFGLGGSARSAGPGFVWYWPITHELVQVPVTMQSLQLCGQFLHANWTGTIPRAVVCALNIQFTIYDAVKAATRVLHFQALVANRAQSLAAEHWTKKGGSFTATEWIDSARSVLAAEMVAYGIKVESLDIASIGYGILTKQVADWSYSDYANGKRPD